jgi:hypothetical protein
VADQNLLMRKLGLVTDTHVETADFARYIDLFLNGLTEDQVELIRELFKDRCMSIGERGCGSLTVEARSIGRIVHPMGQDNIVVWNVRGLNSRAHRDVVHELVAADFSPKCAC